MMTGALWSSSPALSLGVAGSWSSSSHLQKGRASLLGFFPCRGLGEVTTIITASPISS